MSFADNPSSSGKKKSKAAEGIRPPRGTLQTPGLRPTVKTRSHETKHGFSLEMPSHPEKEVSLYELLHGSYQTGYQVAGILESYLLGFMDRKYACPHVSVRFRRNDDPNAEYDMRRNPASIFKEDGFVHIRAYYSPNLSPADHCWESDTTCGHFACVSQSDPWLKNEALLSVYHSHSNVVIRLPFPKHGNWKFVKISDFLKFCDVELSQVRQLDKVTLPDGISAICSPPTNGSEPLGYQLTLGGPGGTNLDSDTYGISNAVIYRGTKASKFLIKHGDPVSGAFCDDQYLTRESSLVHLDDESLQVQIDTWFPEYKTPERFRNQNRGFQGARSYTRKWYNNHFGYLIQVRELGRTYSAMNRQLGTISRYLFTTHKGSVCDHITMCDCYK
jgi:hypothetical protein